MGYYSNFELRSHHEDVVRPDVEDNYCINTLLECGQVFDVKWYECIDDMINLSKLNRDQVFHIHVEGEENGDIWEAKFLNGKHKEVDVEIVIPEIKLGDLK